MQISKFCIVLGKIVQFRFWLDFGLQMQRVYLLFVFSGISIGLVRTGQTVDHPNKETCHSALYVSSIFAFSFFSLWHDFILGFSYPGIFVLFVWVLFCWSSTDDFKGRSELDRTIASKCLCPSQQFVCKYAVSLCGHSAKYVIVTRPHCSRTLEHRPGKSEEEGPCSFVRLFSNYHGEPR